MFLLVDCNTQNIYNEIYIEILTYHEYGKEKYSKLGINYDVSDGFVTENDVWKGNLPVYTADRCIKELDNISFDDESHILFVNTVYKGESRLDSLFHDFRCTDPDNMKNEILA